VSEIVSPHDKFFKTAMSDIRVAREFFENYLPEEIKQYVNLSELELSPKSYIDENLKSSESDILYKTQIAEEEGYLYLLAEHQSTLDPLMPYRLLKYMIGIWSDYLKQTGGKKLPLIVPVVFYHGREPYRYSRDIKDLIAAPKSLVERVLFSPFHLVDTHEIPDEKLREQHWFGISAFFMKHIYARNFLPFLREVLSDLRGLEEKEGSNFVQVLLKYVLSTAEIPNLEAFVTTVQEGLSAPTGEKVMTIAEQLIERGKREGIHQGVHALFTRLLRRKFSILPMHYQQLLDHADEAKINKWSENLIEARTLEEVFA